MTTTSTGTGVSPAGADTTAPAQTDTAEGSQRSVPVMTVVSFLAGCVVMVLAAANITNLSEWADRWGQILVFMVFFIVMAVGGRWFFGGIDAFIAAARRKDT